MLSQHQKTNYKLDIILKIAYELNFLQTESCDTLGELMYLKKMKKKKKLHINLFYMNLNFHNWLSLKQKPYKNHFFDT